MLETVITYSQLWKLWNLRHVSVGTTYIVEKEQTNKRSNSDSYYTWIPEMFDRNNFDPC